MRFLTSALVFILLVHSLLAAVASSHNAEREQDGAYRPRDADHYDSDGHHDTEFDHEAIIGSAREAEIYGTLGPEESKRRLGLLLIKMDLNGDQFIDREELKKWILKSFEKLALEEAQNRLKEADLNGDELISWKEYISDAFGVNSEDEIASTETGDSGMLARDEREMFLAADLNADNQLDINEFEVFSNPEEHVEMHSYLVKNTLREKDKNMDGLIDFQEFIGNDGSEQTKEWLISEKEKFDHELDLNRDGKLDNNEIKAWLVPDNDEIATEEVEHLFAAADDDHDDLLSFDEIILHYDVFVGSEATDYGSELLNNYHFEDEL